MVDASKGDKACCPRVQVDLKRALCFLSLIFSLLEKWKTKVIIWPPKANIYTYIYHHQSRGDFSFICIWVPYNFISHTKFHKRWISLFRMGPLTHFYAHCGAWLYITPFFFYVLKDIWYLCFRAMEVLGWP